MLSLSSSVSRAFRLFSPQNPSYVNVNSKPANHLSLSSAASLRIPHISSSHLPAAIEPDHNNRSISSVALPSLDFADVLFFKSPCNVEIIVDEDEPEESLVGRFRREVIRAGVLQECRYRRFFESNQEKKKRKSRNAARRNRKRRFQPRFQQGAMDKTQEEEGGYKSDEDNWDFSDYELPYA
ncbi:unnamed protein product [Cuscuta europaea]|uniref:Plastid ribosomal protein S21 n=1 Tax=Cuscuta europaea TaxID=41803 RepID=A0A9P0ZV78_CUSEU|nr:unnamed protein product [Cuscuta europaea]